MFENPMPEDADAQAAELDFENQPAAAEEPPAPQPAYQPPAPQYAPEPEPQVDPAQFYAELEELFEEDPLQAAAILAQATAAEQAQQIHQQYAPVVQDYYDRQATEAADALRAEYGDETLQQVLPALVPFIEANEGAFTNPATADAALRMAIDSILYRGGPQPVDPDAAAIEAIGEFAPSAQAQDRFGAQGAGYQSGGAGPRSVGNVYVEGGSTPPPPPRPPMTVDEQIKAEIDGQDAGRDAFGRRGVPARR